MRLSDWRCFCCGELFQTTGCVRGFRCDCRYNGLETECQRCKKCRTHCACAQGYLTVEASVAQKLAEHRKP